MGRRVIGGGEFPAITRRIWRHRVRPVAASPAVVAEALEGRRLLSGASVSGCIWTDVNANGIWDGPDGRAAGWTVYLDQNNNGQLDPGETAVTTDALGWYAFSNLSPGTSTIRYIAPNGVWHAAPLAQDHLTVTLNDGDALTYQDFGVTSANGQIRGTVLAAGAPAEHWGVYIDSNNNGQIDPGEPWTSTDASGQFSFSSLIAGTYTIRVDPLQAWWAPTSGTPASFTVTSDGMNPSAPLTFSYQPTPLPSSYQQTQLVDYLLIGGTLNNDATRNVNPNMLANGWTGYVAQQVRPDIAWGARRIELHNPFGILAGDTLDGLALFRTDQYLEAQAAGLGWLTNDFVSAWKPITQSGVEVIAYIGNPDLDISMQALTLVPAAWNARFDASVAPFIQAGMSIAFDVGQRFTGGDLFNQALERLTAEGVKVYLENRPAESTPYNWQFPIIATDSWPDSDPYVQPSQSWAAKTSELPNRGNVIELIQGPPAGESWSDTRWVVSHVQSILRDGDSVGVQILNLRQDGLTLNDLLIPATPTYGASLGDINGDGKVDFRDLIVLVRYFGQAVNPWTNGDLNGDGVVGFDDLVILAHNYGKSV